MSHLARQLVTTIQEKTVYKLVKQGGGGVALVMKLMVPLTAFFAMATAPAVQDTIKTELSY